MVDLSIKYEVLFDLITGLVDSSIEEEILEKNIPVYLRKLNCFLACILKKTDDGFEEKFILPRVFKKNRDWPLIKGKFQDVPFTHVSNCLKIESHSGFFYYGYRLVDYGVLILGRKKPFEKLFSFELVPVVSLLGKNLNQAIERKLRLESEKKLKLQEEKYRNIISNMNLGLLEVGVDDNIQFCNSSFEQISGYSIKELKGKNASQLLISESHRHFINEKNKRRKTGVTEGYEVLIKNKRGEARWWYVSEAPNHDDQNEITGSIYVHLDITDQKKLEEKLEKALQESNKASKAKELFLANMSHEIRTPLNGIIGMVRQLNKGIFSPQQRLYLNSARKASQHLLSVVNNILDITKIEAGELQLSLEHFTMQGLLKDILFILKPQANQKEIGLNLDIDNKLATAFIGDDVRIKQILINLVGNAIKFTEKGSVTICCSPIEKNEHQQKIKLTIEDTGIGMDKKYVADVFKKFHQEDASISRKFQGTGLGLFITKQLIDLMGGAISVTSTKGSGTKIEVIFSLPFGVLSLIKGQQALKNTDFLKNTRILLTEDNEMNRMVVENALSPLGLQITEAHDGRQAINILKEKSFDIILMDIQMPNLNGIDATKIIRNELMIQTPIIALSANAFKSEIDLCLSVGMNDYLTKPFQEKKLISLIAKHYNPLAEDKNTLTATMPAYINMPLFSLKKLQKTSRGNNEFVVKMMRLFIDMITTHLPLFKQYYSENEISKLNQLAHKLQPSIDNMGIVSIAEELKAIEDYSEDNYNSKALEILIEKVITVLSDAITQIGEHEYLKK